MIDRRPRDGVRLEQEERIILQIPHGELFPLELGKRLARDEHVAQQCNGVRKADAVVRLDGKIEKADVAAIGFEAVDDLGRDVGNKVDLHLRIELVIFHDLIGKHILEDGLGGADAQRARGALFEFGEPVLYAAQKLKRLFHIGEHELAALRGKLHALVQAVKKRRAELSFELFDRLRNGGLRNIELFRRTGKTAAPRDRVKHPVKFKIDHNFFPPTA